MMYKELMVTKIIPSNENVRTLKEEATAQRAGRENVSQLI